MKTHRIDKEHFIKMIDVRFNLNNKSLTTLVDESYLVRIQGKFPAPFSSVEIVDSFYWVKEDNDFLISLEAPNVQYLGYYHRNSEIVHFSQRVFFFVIDSDSGDRFPVAFSITNDTNNKFTIHEKEHDMLLRFRDDHDDHEDILLMQYELMNNIKRYYESDTVHKML